MAVITERLREPSLLSDEQFLTILANLELTSPSPEFRREQQEQVIDLLTELKDMTLLLRLSYNNLKT